MKLIHPKQMTDKQEAALKLALVSSGFVPPAQDVISAVKGRLHAVEPGAVMRNSSFPIAGAGAIDALATDRAERVILINVFPILDAAAICRMFLQADWIVKNYEVLEKFYPDINMAENPRHWVFVEDVSPDVMPLLNRFSRELEAFKYCGIDLEGERWIIVERFGAKKEAARLAQIGVSEAPKFVPEKKYAANLSSSLHFQSVLSKDEVDDFFKDSKLPMSGDEDVTM